MKIAFDVKGTIDGPHSGKVLMLLEALQARGHEVIVWSNSYGFAVDAVKDNELNCVAQSKTTKWDVSYESQYVDVAIEDDTNQTYLAAKRFIWVHDIADLAGGDIIKLADRISSNES